MSSGGADLFVICKNCGSEVSPYVTECPYCGQRLRKRAPKLEKGAPPPPKQRRSRELPRLGRLRRGEIPGIAADRHPWATMVLIVAPALMYLVSAAGAFSRAELAIIAKPGSEWWRMLTAPFVYESVGYAFVALTAVGVFGWLLERRHGPAVVVLIFVSAGSIGMVAAVAVSAIPIAAGANGAALGLLAAWAVPDLLALRRREAVEADWLGVAVFALALLALPALVDTANAIAGIAGGVVGLLLGWPLAQLVRQDR